jgi:hypothetical protein
MLKEIPQTRVFNAPTEGAATHHPMVYMEAAVYVTSRYQPNFAERSEAVLVGDQQVFCIRSP